MNGRLWLGLALVGSVILNAVFVGSYVRTTDLATRTTTAPGRAAIVADRLQLDADQRQLFDSLRSQAQALSHNSIASGEPLAGAFWNEMARDAPDRGRLSLLIADAAERNTLFNEGVTDLLLEFLASLSPRQREQFITAVRDRPILRGRFLMSGHPILPEPSPVVVASQRISK